MHKIDRICKKEGCENNAVCMNMDDEEFKKFQDMDCWIFEYCDHCIATYIVQSIDELLNEFGQTIARRDTGRKRTVLDDEGKEVIKPVFTPEVILKKDKIIISIEPFYPKATFETEANPN